MPQIELPYQLRFKSAWLRKNPIGPVSEFWDTVTMDELIMAPRSIRRRWIKTGYIATRAEVLFILKRLLRLHGVWKTPLRLTTSRGHDNVW
jgi:hypothetical protein